MVIDKLFVLPTSRRSLGRQTAGALPWHLALQLGLSLVWRRSHFCASEHHNIPSPLSLSSSSLPPSTTSIEYRAIFTHSSPPLPIDRAQSRSAPPARFTNAPIQSTPRANPPSHSAEDKSIIKHFSAHLVSITPSPYRISVTDISSTVSSTHITALLDQRGSSWEPKEAQQLHNCTTRVISRTNPNNTRHRYRSLYHQHA